MSRKLSMQFKAAPARRVRPGSKRQEGDRDHIYRNRCQHDRQATAFPGRIVRVRRGCHGQSI